MLELRPIDFAGAAQFVSAYHRHHKAPTGHKFSIACYDGDRLCGVAMVGRPVSRYLDDGRTLEVNRLCTDGTKNACSMLYSASWRAAKALGYKRIFTYKLLTRTSSVSLRKRAERKYRRLLDSIFKQVEGSIVGLSDVAEINRVLLTIANSPQFHDLCTEAARQMATMLAVGQKSTWLAAAKASSQGRTIYRALMRETTNTAVGQTISNIVAQNAQLIKTVPQNLAGQFAKLAQERRFQGIRPEEITKEILSKTQSIGGLKEFGETEARRIARTESAKASTALVQARSEQYGREFYIWDTAGDGDRVRPSHRIMEGVICRWSDPPNPERLAGEKSYGNYHPGGIFNCRCMSLPIIAIEDINFPAKVHIAGSIVTINSLKDFKARFGLA